MKTVVIHGLTSLNKNWHKKKLGPKILYNEIPTITLGLKSNTSSIFLCHCLQRLLIKFHHTFFSDEPDKWINRR